MNIRNSYPTAGQELVPICLPTQKFALELKSKEAVIAGFGRRQTPFCSTDMMGPEAFEICGTPQTCDYHGESSKVSTGTFHSSSNHFANTF